MIFFIFIFKCLAWLAGRSWAEMDGKETNQFKSSIIIGGLFLVTSIVVSCGHWLFWSHLPSTTNFPIWPTLATVIIALGVYRVAMVALENAGRSRIAWYGVLGIIAGGNTVFAGHEVAIYMFESEVNHQMLEDSVHSHGQFRELTLQPAKAKADEITALNSAITKAQFELAAVPPMVEQLSIEMTECESQLNNLRSTATPLGTNGYTRDQRLIKNKSTQCGLLAKERASLLTESIDEKKASLKRLNAQADQMTNDYDTLAQNAQETQTKANTIISQAASTGFARHLALWRAVKSGKISILIVMLVMAMIFIFEMAVFLAKQTLPKDSLVMANIEQKLMEENDHLLQIAIHSAYRHQIKNDAAADNGTIKSVSNTNFTYNVSPLVGATYTKMRINALEANYAAAMKASNTYGKSFAEAFAIPEPAAADNDGKATQPA